MRMMRTVGWAVLMVLETPLAADQPPLWEGFWTDNASWCARAGDAGDETPTWYGRDGFFWHRVEL
jgi:hypothetical protein